MPELLDTERPALSLEKVGVCLHYVEQGGLGGGKAHSYPDCPVLRSMELDLLSYRFQLDPPFGSQCEPHSGVPVQLVLPERLEYHSEGRRVTLDCPAPRRPARLILSSTHFLRSGVRIWHVVITPEPGGRFTEFDVIKLIQLYDGRTEATRLGEQIRFQLPDGREVRAAELPAAAYPQAPPGALLRAGTVQIVTEELTPGGYPLPELLAAVAGAAEEAGPGPGWPDGGSPEARALQACAGIVSGIFDFEEMDADEIRDILEPTVPDSGGLIRIHRCTLTAIADADRPMEACADTVGVSPYLIIPHAALLHNEVLVDAADVELSAVLSNPRTGLQRLEDAHARVDLLLNRLYLPNVFNYRSERVLFQRGAEERGSEERRAAALTQLGELNSRISQAWEERRDRGQMCIAVLLALLSVLQVKDIVFSLVGSGPREPTGWGVLGLAGAALALLIVGFWRLGARR